MKKSNIVRAAKERIKTKKDYWLCEAIRNSAVMYSTEGQLLADDLCAYIRTALRGHTFFEGWVVRYRPKLPRDSQSMRRYRLQWCDWIIEQLEAKGE